MAKRKTLLTSENQWKMTAAYHLCLHRGFKVYQVVGEGVGCVCVFHGTNHLATDGDALIVTSGNGMIKRFGMTGITSKGARLGNYYLPLRRGFELVELPDDFIGMQWNDPAIGRYVADLRASRRSGVSAYSPAPSHCKISSGIDTEEIKCSGLYKSGRTSQSTRRRDYRNYLRFYPDGSVVRTYDFNHQGWRISFEPERLSPRRNEYSEPMGITHIKDGRVELELYWKQAFFARYTGQFRNGRLWLSCESPHKHVAHETLPYRFHPFNPDAYTAG